jgi:hypothetical protein
MDNEHITSATVATAKAVKNALQDVNNNNTQNQLNQFKFQQLEKHLRHQQQLSNEILTHIKLLKNSKGSQRGLLTSPATSPSPFTAQLDYINLTSSQSQVQRNKNTSHPRATQDIK